MRSHINRGQGPVFNHAGQLVSPGAFIRGPHLDHNNPAVTNQPPGDQPILAVTNQPPVTPEEVAAREEGAEAALAIARATFKAAVAAGKPEHEAVREAFEASGGKGHADAFVKALEEGNEAAQQTLEFLKGDQPFWMPSALIQGQVEQMPGMPGEGTQLPNPTGEQMPPVVRAVNPDGTEPQRGPDGLIHGQPLDLTPEQRAALPRLEGQDADLQNVTGHGPEGEPQGDQTGTTGEGAPAADTGKGEPGTGGEQPQTGEPTGQPEGQPGGDAGKTGAEAETADPKKQTGGKRRSK